MAKKNNTPLEKKEQETFFEYVDLLYGQFPLLRYVLFATQSGAWLHGNKGQRSAQIAAARRRGLRDGVADILCLLPMGEYSGLAIELKRQEGGVVTQSQEDWLAAARDAGLYAVVAEGAGEAIKHLNFYLGIA